jgi:hypothetical protein
LIANLKKSKNENPTKRPRAPPTAATMAAKSKRRTSSTMVTSVVDHFIHNVVSFGGLFVPPKKAKIGLVRLG